MSNTRKPFPCTVEAVFIIAASQKDVFLNRRHTVETLTGFNDGYMAAYEEDAEGGCYKTILTCDFDSLKELKSVMNKVLNKSWFLDPTLLIDGKEIYSGNKWL